MAATASSAAYAAAPSTVHYTFEDRYDLKLWTGPTSHPIDAYGGNGGTIDVTVARNANDTYDVRQQMRDVNGAQTLDATYALVRSGTRTLETLGGSTATFRSNGLVRRTTDAYPSGRIAFALPLQPQEQWSAATRDRTSLSIVQTSPSPFREQETTERAEDGGYAARAVASTFTSTTAVRQLSASTYQLSEAGYNTLTQTFALPHDGVIDVISSGQPPLPVKPGTVKMPSWYPYADGALTRPLQRDHFHVVGSAKVPSLCRRRVNQTATRIDENGYTVDPVRGSASAFSTVYFLIPVTKETLLIACVAENYAEGVWANGWAMSAGHWGKLTRLQSGERLYVAGDVPAGAATVNSFAGFPVVGLDAIAMRRTLTLEGVPQPLRERR